MGFWVAVFLGIVAVTSALPTVERVKRADETVMFGNQQNLAHKSVKKSGPAPPESKLAQKQEEVAEAKAKKDPEMELPHDLPPPIDEDQLESELATLIQSKHEPTEEDIKKKKAKKAAKKAVKKEKPTVDLNLAEAEKRTPQKKEKTRKDYEEDMRYLSYLINKMNPEEAFEIGPRRGQSQRRRKRSAIVTDAKLQRLRRSLSSMATESHMAASAQHRKKRDASYDPRRLAMLEYMLSQANDGYEAPEEVEEPMYEAPFGAMPALSPEGREREREEDEALARLEAESDAEEAARRNGDYPMAKRAPDFEAPLEGPFERPEFIRSPQMMEEEEEPQVSDEEPREPVSVYNSEYGPLVYSVVEHKGTPGLFVPLEQPSMTRLAAAEEKDRAKERERLNVLGALLSLNQNEEK